MKIEQIESKWDELKGQVREKWNKITKDDIEGMHSQKDQLIKKLRERYQYTADQAERELGIFMKDCSCGTAKTIRTSEGPASSAL
jgi:uncharacterized protein YjbJ (UPF0337 family)